MEDELKVSRDLMKVVSADTRTKILRFLDQRQMTASELSKTLDKHVTTVTEHLDLLERSNLIERMERPGRKWVYYKLTRLGKQILHPQPYKVILVLTLSFLSLGLGTFMMPQEFRIGQQFAAVSSQLKETTPALGGNLENSSPVSVQPDYSRFVISLAFIGASLFGVVYSAKQIIKSSRVPI
jgi:DNA-binding transcriptional ArsR family regulator